MLNPLQSRTLAVAGAALPVFNGAPVLVPVRLSGTETLGELFEYTLELKTAIRWRSRRALRRMLRSTS
ncbi:MAG TPA: hypothetical protein VGZ01_13910 [Trinickia sp.]|nr:hypothetical protein [Trinickia sp.]